jgi:hypothetical protein
VAIDAMGNAVAAWQRMADIEVARYDVAADTWSGALTASTGLALDGPALAGDGDGNAVVLWRLSSGAVETTRYDAAPATWATTQTIVGAAADERPTVAMDPLGNAVAFWPSPALATGSAQGARFLSSTSTWTAVSTIPTSAPLRSVEAAADGGGNVGIVWDGVDGTIRVTRWTGTPRAPVIAVSAADSVVTIHITPPVTSEPAFAPTAYEYAIWPAALWVRVPLSSPLVIPGVPAGAGFLQVRAVNRAGPGDHAASQFVMAPDPPLRLAAFAVVGNVVTLAWEPPSNVNDEYTTYVIEGGVAPGQVLATLPTGSSASAFTFTAPSGVFYLRVRTVYAQLSSQPSNEIVLAVNVAAPPSAPADLLGLAYGSDIALSWTNTFAGGAPAATYLMVSGTLSGVVPLGQADTFRFAGVPAGTYTFQVVAANDAGASPPSNAVTLTFPWTCSGGPGMPLRLAASLSGRTLRVAWSPPDSGAAATGYVLLVNGVVNGAFPIPNREIAAAVPPGSYSFRVQATNACGASVPSAAVSVMVP